MQIFKTLLGLALTVTLAGSAFAAEGAPRQHHDPLERLQAKLKLSDTQVSQLRPTFAEMRQDHKAEHDRFRANFRSILTPDQLAKLDAQPKEGHHHHMHLKLTDAQKAKLQAFRQAERPAMKAEHEKIKAQMMAVLTPDQQAKLKEMRHHHHHHGHGGWDNKQG